MNNEQFRRLVLDTTTSTKSSKDGSATSPRPRLGHSSGDRATTTAAASRVPALGSRMRSNIPMTPRSVTAGSGADFARQLAEHRQQQRQHPAKRFKASAAPKGTKLPSGYQDRARLRQEQGHDDDAADDEQQQVQEEEQRNGMDLEKRVQALEEMVKLGQIDQRTFERLRTELGVGGDVKSTHMVKGLDWDLLRRVKAGEDVTKASEVGKVAQESSTTTTGTTGGDVDEEFERLLEGKEKDVLPAAPKEKRVKRGVMAPPPPPPPAPAPTPGQKMSRDEILKQLKASRAAAAAAAATATATDGPTPPEPTLGSKFKKIGDTRNDKKRWIEQDETGRRREVLLVTDGEGRTKRKVRWLDKPGQTNGNPALPAPDRGLKPLGMEVPTGLVGASTAAAQDSEDDDIFAGAGADYNPLAGIGDEGDTSSSDDQEEEEEEEAGDASTSRVAKAVLVEPSAADAGDAAAKAAKTPAHQPRNYFSTSTTVSGPTEDEARTNPLTKDPTILAALKRAAALRQAAAADEGIDDNEEEEDVEEQTLLRRKKFLEEARRREAQDAMDMDLGFGSSRIEDDEDDEAVLFEGRGGGSKKRKRGPKKRKGDKDSASDVLLVLEGRRKASE